MKLEHLHNLDTNYYLKALINFLLTLKNDFQPLSEEEKSALSEINQHLKIYPQSKKIAKILSHFCRFHNQKNCISPSNKYVDALFQMLDETDIDLYHQGLKLPLAQSMLHVVENSPYKIQEKVELINQFLEKIAKKSNINELKVLTEDSQSIPLINYFLGNNQPPAIIGLLFKNYQQYQIDFTQQDMYFLRYVVANFHNAEKLTIKETMFTLLDVDLLNEKFNLHAENSNEKAQLFNRVLINSSFKFITHLIDNHQELVKKTDIYSSDIMKNSFLSINEKMKLLTYFNCKELMQYDVFHSLLISNETNENSIKNFLSHCYHSYKINHSLDSELNHLICDYTMLNNPSSLEPFILNMNIEHFPNNNADYPIHVLLKNNNFDAKKATMRLLNYFKDKGVNLHTIDGEGNNALHLALNTHQTDEVLLFLMDENISLSQKNKAGISPYLFLSEKSNLDATLLEKATSYYEKEILDNQLIISHNNKKHKI